MHRSARVALLPFLLGSWASLGCDISSKPFAGTIVQMTLSGVSTIPQGQHLELWARNQYNDVVRVSGSFDTTVGGKSTRLFPVGFTIRPAITMDDPCMIDQNTGALLTKAEAYKDVDLAGQHQTPEEQAQQVRTRIGQLTPISSCDGSPESKDPVLKAYHCGLEGSNILYGVIAYETVDATGMLLTLAPESPKTCETSGNAAGCIPFDAAPADRLAVCKAYWDSSPLAYSPNPLQLTAPIHGQLYGFPTFLSILPPGQFDSIRIDSPINLSGIQELWMTTEPDQVDPKSRGPVFLDGTPGEGGMDIVHIDLAPPFGVMAPISGTAALEVDLDQDPVQF